MVGDEPTETTLEPEEISEDPFKKYLHEFAAELIRAIKPVCKSKLTEALCLVVERKS
jgi:hypothetical protein